MIYDFVIFGSGISSKITAIALAKNNFSVCLISDNDFNNKKNIKSNLVTFLSNGSVNYLQSILKDPGVFNQFETIDEISCKFNGVKGNVNETISFNENKVENLGKIIQNTFFEEHLNSELAIQKNIHYIKDNKIIGTENLYSSVKIKLEDESIISTKLFLLSSSQNSQLINELNIKFIKKNFHQEALSVSIETILKKQNCAYQIFTTDGPLALLPYRKNEASVVWSLNKESEIFKLDKEQLEFELTKKLNQYVSKLKIKSIERHGLKLNYAKTLIDKKTLLLGNLAHSIHPIAGQGLNLTIKDIALFIKVISKYRSIGYELYDEAALQYFDDQRKLDNMIYSFGTFTLEGLVTNNNKIINFTTGKGINLIQRIKFLKEIFVNSATGKSFFKSL